jgi:hypothetical protein
MNRREMLATTSAATLGALCMPKLVKADAPASRVAIVRCRDYAQYGQQLSQAFDQIGGIEKLVRGKIMENRNCLCCSQIKAELLLQTYDSERYSNPI